MISIFFSFHCLHRISNILKNIFKVYMKDEEKQLNEYLYLPLSLKTEHHQHLEPSLSFCLYFIMKPRNIVKICVYSVINKQMCLEMHAKVYGQGASSQQLEYHCWLLFCSLKSWCFLYSEVFEFSWYFSSLGTGFTQLLPPQLLANQMTPQKSKQKWAKKNSVIFFP